MASAKVERPATSAQAQVQSLFGQAKKEPVKAAAAADGATKAQASKPTASASKAAPKKAEQKPRELKKKAKSVKPAPKK